MSSDVINALTADAAEVDRLVADLDDAGFAAATPAVGWTVAHQVGHLAFVFRIAGLAAAEPDGFRAMLSTVGDKPGDFDAAVNAALADYLGDPADVLVSRWRAERDTAVKALAALPGDQLVPWLVRPIPAALLCSAGMMELFAHGQDIADALGVRREHTDRIRAIVNFAVIVWEFGYQSRGETPPDTAFGFDLVAPSGAKWTFGPDDAEQRISGSATDFCLLVTRRRHRADLDLVATGPDADHWLDIAQAYRGPAGAGRSPGQFGGR